MILPAVLLLLQTQEAAPIWHEDFDAGLAAARASGLDLLIDFTGSDWCVPCRLLKEKVLDQPEFLAGAARNFVLVRLDYPRETAARERVPHPERNAQIAAAWGVASFPTLILADAEGVPYAESGFQDLAPPAFLEDLRALRASAANLRPQVAALDAQLRAGKDLAAPARAAIRLLRATDPRLRLREGLLLALRAARPALAATDAALAFDCLQVFVETGLATAEEEAEAIRADPRNEAGLYEKVLLVRLQRVQFVADMEVFNRELEVFVALQRYHDAAACTRMLVQSSRFYHNYLSRPQGARLMAERARALGPVAPEDADWLRKMLGS